MRSYALRVSVLVLVLALAACSSASSTDRNSLATGIAATIYATQTGSVPTANATVAATDTSMPATVVAKKPLTATPAWSLGQWTKTSGCVSQNALPDQQCTPGAIFPDATAAQICVPGYSKSVRDVPQSVKDQAYAEYGITHHATGEYEVDHLISLELGGSNDIANLFPEAAEPRPGFHEKDQVENYLHDQVCSGAMSLQDAQIGIAQNWLQFYGLTGPLPINATQSATSVATSVSGHRYVASSQAKKYY